MIALCTATVVAQNDASNAARTYSAPDHNYSFPVPAGWSLIERRNSTRVTGPDGEIDLHIVVLAGKESLDAAVEEAWALPRGRCPIRG